MKKSLGQDVLNGHKISNTPSRAVVGLALLRVEGLTRLWAVSAVLDLILRILRNGRSRDVLGQNDLSPRRQLRREFVVSKRALGTESKQAPKQYVVASACLR